MNIGISIPAVNSARMEVSWKMQELNMLDVIPLPIKKIVTGPHKMTHVVGRIVNNPQNHHELSGC